jgi:CRP-like cAMP-binding protein
MAEKPGFQPHRSVSELLLRTASRHGTLLAADESALLNIRSRTRRYTAGDDIVRQGERPDVAVLVLSGMVARYHTLPSGDRQYLSFHIAGDMPDVQSLFLSVMDHSLCALNQAEIAAFPHSQVLDLVVKHPGVGFAFWRLTLIDAAIFRQAITNNSARSHVDRLAHLFCELYYRAREAKIADGLSYNVPLNQAQLGQALGMSHISVNRALQKLRRDRLAEFRAGRLEILNWTALTRLAGFDPVYLHLDKQAEISRTGFRSRRP